MTTQNAQINIEYLVNLIENSTNPEETYKNNLELWSSFSVSIREFLNANINHCQPIDNKLFKILDFLFKYEQGELRDLTALTYLQEDFRYYIINSLLTRINKYFFELEPEETKNIINFISTNITTLIQIENNRSARVLMSTYFQIIPNILKFMGEKVFDDKLIRQTKEYKIKDIYIVRYILKNVPITMLFEGGVTEFLRFFDGIDYMDIDLKKKITKDFFDSFIENDNSNKLLELVVNENDSPLWKDYIDEEKKDKIIRCAMRNTIENLTTEQIKYLLKCLPKIQEELDGILFRYNCLQLIRYGPILPKAPVINTEEIETIFKHLFPYFYHSTCIYIKTNDDIETKKKKAQINWLNAYSIDKDSAIDILKAALSGKIKIDVILAMQIISSIAEYLEKELEIKNDGIYFVYNKKSDAAQCPGTSMIRFNVYLACRLLPIDAFSLSSKLYVFETILHELEHNLDDKKQRDGDWDIVLYEKKKEFILKDCVPRFYTDNYSKLKFECDAYLASANRLQKFVEAFLPEYLDEFQDEIITKLEQAKEKEQNLGDRQISVLGAKVSFQTAFDTFVRYNSDILEKNPILNLEYYPNGLPKTAEDIWLSRTEQNKDLIDGIIKNRYPEPDANVLTK